MKKYSISSIIIFSVSVFIVFLTFIGLCIPYLSVSSGDVSESIYYFQAFNGISSSGESTLSFSIVGILAAFVGLVSPILFNLKNKTARVVAYSLALTSIAFNFFLFATVQTTLDQVPEAARNFLHTPGHTLILTTNIFFLIFVICMVVYDFASSMIIDLIKKMKASNRSTSIDYKEKLTKLDELHNDKLISDEEYQAKRKEILDEIAK